VKLRVLLRGNNFADDFRYEHAAHLARRGAQLPAARFTSAHGPMLSWDGDQVRAHHLARRASGAGAASTAARTLSHVADTNTEHRPLPPCSSPQISRWLPQHRVRRLHQGHQPLVSIIPIASFAISAFLHPALDSVTQHAFHQSIVGRAITANSQLATALAAGRAPSTAARTLAYLRRAQSPSRSRRDLHRLQKLTLAAFTIASLASTSPTRPLVSIIDCLTHLVSLSAQAPALRGAAVCSVVRRRRSSEA